MIENNSNQINNYDLYTNNYFNEKDKEENKNNNSKFLYDKKISQIVSNKIIDLINSSNKKKINNKTESIKKIENGHLSIYEREKRNMLRKANQLKKKKQLEEQQQLSNLKQHPTIDEISKNILLQNGDYIPIQERAKHLHHMHQSYSLLNEKNNMQKKENQEIMEKRKFQSKKNFNINDWNNFLESQYIWNQEKLMKKKAGKIMKENSELKMSHQPKIDLNSKRIISNMRKGVYFEDDIYNKLYNDFNNLQERKQLKMSNSMPSFKPFINKGIKKNTFKSKDNINKNTKKRNKEFTRANSALNINYILENKKNKNVNNKNKKIGNKTNISSGSKNNDKSMNTQRMNSARNYSNGYGSYLYKKFINKNHAKKN